jgi:hypothetical protein
MDLEEKSISKKIKSILKPSSNKARESNYPISTTKAVKGVLSSAECFTSDPAPRVRKEPEPEPELYNYKGQVVTRSAMELLEAEDRLAAKGGLFERDGMILTGSALSLLQAQEAMDRADSAGQGEYGRKSCFVPFGFCKAYNLYLQRMSGIPYGESFWLGSIALS